MESGMDLSWNIQDDILDSQDHCFTPEQVAERNASNGKWAYQWFLFRFSDSNWINSLLLLISGPKFYLADSDEDSSSSETSSDDDSD